MIKKLLVIAVVALAMFGLSPSGSAQATQQDKVEICHRTAAVTNPYGPKKIEVNFSAVDGEGSNDHTSHTGDVFDSNVHKQGDTWGDIIPDAADGGVGAGLNWTTAGKAIWNNDCQPVPEEGADIVFEVVCTEIDGKTCVQVTFRNFGDSQGSAFLNDEEVVVAAGATVVRTVDLGTEVKIVIDEKTVYEDTPECEEEPEEEGEVLAEEDTPEGAVDAGMGSVALLGLIASGAVVAGGVALARKQTN